jgi:hypothetical protein
LDIRKYIEMFYKKREEQAIVSTEQAGKKIKQKNGTI